MERESDAALLIIDVQNDFCPGGSLAVPDGDAVVPVINCLMEKFTAVIATQDWHPSGHVSFASNHRGKEPHESIMVEGRAQMLWPDHCVAGTRGAELHGELNRSGVGLILRKGMRPGLDSYSAFYENDRGTSTGLNGYLRELGITRLFLCGLASDVCVFFSAMDGVRLGYGTTVIRDGVRGVDVPPGNIADTEEQMRREGVKFLQSTDLLP
jgi:nicotinamidase/pyrazinamidase